MKNLLLCIALLSLVGTAVSSTTFNQLSQLKEASFHDVMRMLQQSNTTAGGANNTSMAGFSVMQLLAAKTVVQALVSIAIGAFLSFFGYKIFKVTVFVAGFFVGFQIYVAYATDAAGSVSFVSYLIAVAIGAVAGYLNLFCLKVTYFLLGFLTGGIAFAIILGVVFSTYNIVLNLIVALACGIAAVYLFQIFIIIGTTFIGCFNTFSGLAYFTGGSTTAVVILTILMVLKFGAGFVKQWRDWRGDQAREAMENEKKAPLQEGYIVEMPANSNGLSTLSTQESAKGNIYDPYRPQQQQV